MPRTPQAVSLFPLSARTRPRYNFRPSLVRSHLPPPPLAIPPSGIQTLGTVAPVFFLSPYLIGGLIPCLTDGPVGFSGCRQHFAPASSLPSILFQRHFQGSPSPLYHLSPVLIWPKLIVFSLQVRIFPCSELWPRRFPSLRERGLSENKFGGSTLFAVLPSSELTPDIYDGWYSFGPPSCSNHLIPSPPN